MSKNAKGKKKRKLAAEADDLEELRTDAGADDDRAESGAENLRKPVTLRLNVEAIDYFKAEAERTGVPYQNIINAFLVQCMREERHLSLV